MMHLGLLKCGKRDAGMVCFCWVPGSKLAPPGKQLCHAYHQHGEVVGLLVLSCAKAIRACVLLP